MPRTLLGVILVIGFVASLLLTVTPAYRSIGLALSAIWFVAIIIYLLFYIPSSQRIALTAKGIHLHSYGHCRTFLWLEIAGVELRTCKDDPGQDVLVLKVARVVPDSEAATYSEIIIDGSYSNYQVEELHSIITARISPGTCAT